MKGAGSERWVRARGARIWNVRVGILWVLAFFLLMSVPEGLDPAQTAGAVLLALACTAWTLRVGVRAGADSLTVVGLFRTHHIPVESIRSLHVARTNIAWHKVIDLQVRLADGDVVWVPWVSWGTQLEQIMTVEPPPLPRPSQQRVLDELTTGLGLARPAPASD